MSSKNKHFVTIVSPVGDSVTVDIDLDNEEYKLLNRISVLFTDVASINEPILVVSQPSISNETVSDLDTNPPTDSLPVIDRGES